MVKAASFRLSFGWYSWPTNTDILGLKKPLPIINNAKPKNKKKQIYIKDFKVDDKEWLNVLTFIKDIVNMIISNNAQFKNEYIIKDFNERLLFCENLIDNETIVINELRKIDPVLADKCVPSCIYRGFCPEIKSCGYYKTEDFQKRLKEYRNTSYEN